MAFGRILSASLDKPVVYLKNYRSMIRSLLFLTVSQPNIMFSMCNCARYPANPRETHFTIMKNFFRNRHRKPTLCLWYHVNTFFFIQSYSDVDLGGCQLECKSTTGGC